MLYILCLCLFSFCVCVCFQCQWRDVRCQDTAQNLPITHADVDIDDDVDDNDDDDVVVDDDVDDDAGVREKEVGGGSVKVVGSRPRLRSHPLTLVQISPTDSHPDI